MANGYTTGVRQALNQKGIGNERITYDPAKGGVMVDNKPFTIPGTSKNYNGSVYTDQTGFNNAWNAYAKANPAQSKTGSMLAGYGQKPDPRTTGFTSPSTGYTTPTAYPTTGAIPSYMGAGGANAGVDQRINDLYSMLNNQAAYDPYSSAAYQAAQAQVARGVQQATRQAQESYGSSGFGRSSQLGERVAGIGNEAQEYLMTQVVPQLEAQEQARRQQQFQNQFSLLTPQQQQQQFAEQTAQSRAGLTGSFLAPEAQNVMTNLNNLKAYAQQNWQAMTPQEREQVRAQGDQYRALLQGYGVDPSQFGAGVTAAQAMANVGRAGAPTLAAGQQAYEQAADIRDYNRAALEADRAFKENVRQYDTSLQYTQGRDKTKDAQWQAEFNRIAEQDGIDNAMKWANLTINQQQQALSEAEFADTSAYRWAGLDAELAKAAAQGEKYEGMSANDVVSNVRKNFEVMDAEGKGTGKLPTDQKLRDQMYMQIIGAGLPDAEESQALAAVGFSKKQIEAMDARLLEPSGK